MFAETLVQRYFNQCDDENGCDRQNFDYGIISAVYRYHLNDRISFNAGLNMASSYTTEWYQPDHIINSSKYYSFPVGVTYYYFNRDHFRLSSGAGISYILIAQKNEILENTPVNFSGLTSFSVQLINASFNFGNSISPFISFGIG